MKRGDDQWLFFWNGLKIYSSAATHKDLRVRSDRNGGARFRFTRQKTVPLTDHRNVNPQTGNRFVLEVEGVFTGNYSWSLIL